MRLSPRPIRYVSRHLTQDHAPPKGLLTSIHITGNRLIFHEGTLDQFLRVGDEEGGQRLDKFVSAKLPAMSRSLAQQLIERGLVVAGESLRKSNYRVKPGELITVGMPEPQPSVVQGEQIPLEIVYEDDALLVVDKPPGMVVHPASGHATGTLANAILGHSPGIVIGSAERPGLVHRLDRDTSGLIVIAKQDTTLKRPTAAVLFPDGIQSLSRVGVWGG